MLNTDAQIKNRFQTHIQEKNLFRKEDLLILAVSGGVDSMVLTELCRLSGYNIVLAHCNFQLRGEESMRDQNFVKSYAELNQIPFYTVSFDTQDYIAVHKLSVQEGARQLRYQWFHELADELSNENGKTTYILTAHHADDQVETMMMNFFRGTGLKGLTGIPEKNGRILRPLLSFRKSELIDYATNQHISYIEDSSNLTSDYTRNLIRNEILPALEKVYPQVKENILDNADRFQSVLSLYEKTIKPVMAKIIHHRGDEIHLSIRSLFRYQNTSLIFEILHPYGFTEGQINEVIKLKDANTGSYVLSPKTKYRLIKERQKFILAPPQDETSEMLLWEQHLSLLTYAGGILKGTLSADQKLSDIHSSDIIQLDADKIDYPLILRKWKEGDYFYPLGLGKKKKVARFMIDLKFSKTDKEKLWILESQSRIIWLIGHRLDDRFKVTEHTQSILKIERRVS